MGVKILEAGELGFKSERGVNRLFLIMKGSVRATFADCSYVLKNGDIIALCHTGLADSGIEYEVLEKTNTVEYVFEKGHIKEFLMQNKDIKKYLISTLFKQLSEISGRYRLLKNEYDSLKSYLEICYDDCVALCEEMNTTPGELNGYQDVMDLDFEEILPDWMTGYYMALEEILEKSSLGEEEIDFLSGLVTKAARDIIQMIVACGEIGNVKMDIVNLLMNENGNDIFEMYISVYHKAVKNYGIEAAPSNRVYRTLNDIIMQVETQELEDIDLVDMRKKELQEAYEEAEKISEGREKHLEEHGEEQVAELNNSVQTIVDYSLVDRDLANEFVEHITEYKKLSNKNGTEDEVRILRQRITKEFNEIYAKAFLRSMNENSVPPVLKMFFNFGYVDEELVGMENAVFLYELSKKNISSPEKGVYTIYEWLEDIYFCEKDPGRNEFEVDYADYLHEQFRNKAISKTQEQEMFNDKESRVLYELENIFPVVNKTTTGRITTFCPVLSEHNIMKSLENMLITAKKVTDIVDRIRSIDVGAFYRETVFTAPESGISKEFIDVEILPNFVLMPNIGNRGIMWQEIEGKRRTTPARMFLSVFQQEDLGLQIMRLTGQFRWEMCKRVQGARWNDVTERSLTSEYFDYIQYYRKNNDLSPEAKEKIKNDLVRSKNSFREMFIRDYVVWVQFESVGSPRLNKVVRTIMCSYIPFSKAIREKLKINPMYKDMMERYEVKQKAKVHRIDNLMKKVSNMGKTVPDEIVAQMDYLES